jgi:hypothetical protein
MRAQLDIFSVNGTQLTPVHEMKVLALLDVRVISSAGRATPIHVINAQRTGYTWGEPALFVGCRGAGPAERLLADDRAGRLVVIDDAGCRRPTRPKR